MPHDDRPNARERILDAAAPLLYRQGVRGTGIDAVIAASGVAKATLYRHFRSKDVLVEAFLRRRDAAWRDWLEGRVDELCPDRTPRERVLAVFDALGEWFASEDFRGCAFINTAAEITQPDHPALAAVRDHKRLLRAYLRALAGALEVRDTDAVADGLLLLVEGAIVCAQIENDPAAALRARAAAASLMVTHGKERE